MRSVALEVGGVVATTTWNPSDKDAGITLSNGNLTATDNANDGTQNGVRAIASHSSGSYYCEFTMTNTPNAQRFGIGNAAADLTIPAGNDNNAVAMNDGGVVFLNNSGIGTGTAISISGDVIGMAVDLTAQKIWFRVNGGIWNNNGANDPATGVGGISYAGIASGPYFPIMSIRNLCGATANFGATAYASAAPSGFGNW